MTVTYAALKNADLGTLRTLIDTWDAARGKTVDARQSFDDVTPHLNVEDGWTGEAAAAAELRGGELLTLIRAGITESFTIANILVTGQGRLQSAQEDLNEVVDTLAGIPELSISDTGIVELDYAAIAAGTSSAGTTAASNLVWLTHRDEYQSQIDAALTAADEADTEVAEALRLAGETDNTADLSFNGDALDIDQLAAMRERAADAAALLDRDPSDLGQTELDQLNELLTEYGDHPAFADAFFDGFDTDGEYADTPQEAFLRRYGELLDHHFGSGGEDEFYGEYTDELEALQRNLGWTLATATDPENQPHMSAEAVEELMTLGGTQLELDTDNSDPNVFGYEILGPLLRHGVYHEDFIVPVAEHLTRIDDLSRGLFPDTMGGVDVFDPRGPMEGSFPLDNALLGLRNNPDAATAFFAWDGTYDDRTYLFGDPEDPQTLDEGVGDDRVEWMLDRAQQDGKLPLDVGNLGGALEAAATGITPGDEDAVHAPPTVGNARVASDMLTYLGDDDHDEAISGTDEELSGLNGNVANVMVNYMSDVHGILGDQAVDGTLNSWAIPPHDNTLTDVDSTALQRVLGALGHDPEAALRVAVGSEINGNLQFVTALDQGPLGSSATYASTMEAHANVMGYLTDGDLDQIIRDYEAEHSGGIPFADIVSETAKNGAGAVVGVATENPWAGAAARQGSGYLIDWAIDPFRAEPDPGPGEEVRDAGEHARQDFAARFEALATAALAEQGHALTDPDPGNPGFTYGDRLNDVRREVVDAYDSARGRAADIRHENGG